MKDKLCKHIKRSANYTLSSIRVFIYGERNERHVPLLFHFSDSNSKDDESGKNKTSDQQSIFGVRKSTTDTQEKNIISISVGDDA
jgi:hypothetical protein